MHKLSYRARGMTIIEMLIAMLISVFLMAALDMAFLTTKKNISTEDRFQNLATTMNQVMQMMTHKIHLAGNLGCANLTADFPIASNCEYNLNSENKIMGSDVTLTLRGGSEEFVSLLETPLNLNVLLVSTELNFHPHDIAMISDCASAEIFKIKSVEKFLNKQKIILQNPLHKIYEAKSEIRNLELNTYFVKDTQRRDNTGKAIDALYVRNIHHHTEELVEGIKGMHFSYDVIQNNKLINKEANQVTDWSRVVGVNIILNLSSAKNNYIYAALKQ